MSTEKILSDLGERQILRDIIPKYVSKAGDDCAIISLNSDDLVITTDPVPVPAAKAIAGNDDLYWAGWLLVTINASDIAASGAKPLAFVAALDLPNDTPVSSLERLLLGISESCAAHDLRYVGGNLRESERFAAVGTAIGTCKQPALQRRGARPGDLVAVIGQGGRFWSDVLRIRAGEKLDPKTSPVFAPVAQTRAMQSLHEAKIVRCAMDTSDGLAPTLEELAAVNQLEISVDLAALREHSDFDGTGERVERLWMGWGDWTVVAVVSPEDLPALEALPSKHSIIGQFGNGDAEVLLLDGGEALRMGRLESERFAPDSWFSRGIEGYLQNIRAFPLPDR
jgi:thiamine-monophosphate kinase